MKKRVVGFVAGVLAVGFLLAPVAFPGGVYRAAVSLERGMAGLQEKTVTLGDQRIHYLDGGQGEAVLLVHGFGADKDVWTRMARHLTPRYRVVVPDLPGFGESTKSLDASYDIPSQVQRLDRFVRALELESFHVAGNSMGGAIAGQFAARFPDKVRSLALMNTAGVTGCPERSDFARRLEKGENPLLVHSEEAFETKLDMVFVDPPWIPGPVRRYLARQEMEDRALLAAIFGQIHQDGSSLVPRLPEIRARTLVLWGDRDRLIHVSCTTVLEQGLPDSSTVVMKDCGHVPMIERPGETADHYLRFLRRG